jgi:hypothetical protein
VNQVTNAVLILMCAAAAAGACWHLPPCFVDEVQVVQAAPVAAASDLTEGIWIFHDATKLGPVGDNGQPQAADVDWSRDDLIRVRWAAPGFMPDRQAATSEPPFGSLTYRVRLAGTQVFFYRLDPRPGAWGGEVRQTFAQHVSESWFTVPKNARVVFTTAGRADLLDMAFALGAIPACVAGAALVGYQRRNQRRPHHTQRRDAPLGWHLRPFLWPGRSAAAT